MDFLYELLYANFMKFCCRWPAKWTWPSSTRWWQTLSLISENLLMTNFTTTTTTFRLFMDDDINIHALYETCIVILFIQLLNASYHIFGWSMAIYVWMSRLACELLSIDDFVRNVLCFIHPAHDSITYDMIFNLLSLWIVDDWFLGEYLEKTENLLRLCYIFSFYGVICSRRFVVFVAFVACTITIITITIDYYYTWIHVEYIPVNIVALLFFFVDYVFFWCYAEMVEGIWVIRILSSFVYSENFKYRGFLKSNFRA